MKKILIVRPDRIGDFLIFSSILKYYRDLFKDFEIHLLVIPLVKPLAEHCPYVDKVILFDSEISIIESPVRFLKQAKNLQANFYEKVIYPIYARNRDKIAIGVPI